MHMIVCFWTSARYSFMVESLQGGPDRVHEVRLSGKRNKCPSDKSSIHLTDPPRMSPSCEALRAHVSRGQQY